jgi:hypothetical protein
MAGEGSHPLDLSSGGSEIHHQDPLCLKHGPVSWRLMGLDCSYCLLAGKLATLLHCLVLNVGLLRMVLCSLPLLNSTSSLKGEAVSSHGANARGGTIIVA